MRFLSRYELKEQLTMGTVETFAAHRVGGGERLLVHLFQLRTRPATDPTNLELLHFMQELAPPPPGLIVDAGRYDDGSQAFVVSKFPPEQEALQQWINAYKASAVTKDATAEMTAIRLPAEVERRASSPESAPARAPSAPGAPAFPTAGEPMPPPRLAVPPSTPPATEAPGEFTRMFRSLRPSEAATSAAESASEGNPPTREPKPVVLGESRLDEGVPEAEPPAGSFTREFFGLAKEEKLTSLTTPTPEPSSRTPEAAPLTPKVREADLFPEAKKVEQMRAEKAKPGMGEFQEPPSEAGHGFGTDVFAVPEKAAGDEPIAAAADESRPGEFTAFFRSPFATPGKPARSPLPQGPPAPAPAPVKGEFTALFGKPSGMASSTPMSSEPLVEPAAPPPQSGSFTEMFEKPRAPQPPKPFAPPSPSPVPPAPSEDAFVLESLKPTHSPSPPQPAYVPPTTGGSSSPFAPSSAPFPQPSPRPAMSMPEVTPDPSEGATRIFTPPTSRSAGRSAPPPAQPDASAYERVVAAGPPKAAAPLAGSAAPPPAQPPSAVPMFGMPQISVPPPPPVPSPVLPAMGTLQPPPPPVFPAPLPAPQLRPPAPPPLPAVPAVPAPGAPSTASLKAYGPLILILGLLGLAALALVLFFVFRH